jgi:hypothetical protein
MDSEVEEIKHSRNRERVAQGRPNSHAHVNLHIDSIDFVEREHPMLDSGCQSVHQKQYL